MSKRNGGTDKNLANTVRDLEHTPVNSLEAIQQQEDINDRRRTSKQNRRD